MFDYFEITGMAYPVGSACRDYMTIYFHDNGYFYLYMGGGPLIQAGNTVDYFLDGLIGDDDHEWSNIRLAE